MTFGAAGLLALSCGSGFVAGAAAAITVGGVTGLTGGVVGTVGLLIDAIAPVATLGLTGCEAGGAATCEASFAAITAGGVA